jgi:hypothetical protein
MPYSVRKVDCKYCVYKKGGGKKVGCTKGTETAKNKYLAALHANADEEESKKTFKEYFAENFIDGKKKGKSRPGRAKRAGIDCSKSKTELRKIAKNSSGEKQKMAHFCANMKGSNKKSENEEQRLDDKCWKGYKKQGTKIKGGKRVNNCVKK